MNSPNDPRTILPGSTSLKAVLHEEEALIRSAHQRGAGGGETVLRRTALIDRVLQSVYQTTAPSEPRPALIATGGYGRGELNPFSNIDLLFLCRNDQDREESPRILYALWDAGLDIAYSVRTIDECIELSRQDNKIRTSLLESRRIAGDEQFYRAYLQRMQAEAFYHKPREYTSEKIAERIATRQKYGGSLYLREPNIKESTGGLREYHTARWLALTHFRVSSLDEVVPLGVITALQASVFRRSLDFLWKVRNELHYQAGRKNDHLTYDLQEIVARQFRYRDSAHLFSVERFMKSYFLHARTIQEFCRTVTGRILPPLRRSWFARSRVFGPFTLTGNILSSADTDRLRSEPALLMNAFSIFQERHAVFSDALQHMIATVHVGDEVRCSPAAAKTFLEILNRPERLSETLWSMKDLRFLGRYLPEFRSIQALARRDYYHTYTVDEHILTAIRALEDVWQGTYPAHRTLFDALRMLQRRWVLMLTVLLHDLGKAVRTDHERQGVFIAERILDRLGVTGTDRKRILFLIEHHLLMSALSQRRELTDRKVIAEFADAVGDGETLAMLYLLTYADTAAVSPSAWTAWKAALLQDLYLRTLAHLQRSGLDEGGERSRVQAAGQRLSQAAEKAFSSDEVRRFIETMPDHYLVATSVEKQLMHLDMVRRLRDEQLVISYRHRPDRGYTELTVCAYDAYGMFYRTAGAIAAQNLNILRAQVYTARNGIMIDTFQVTDALGTITTYEDVWSTVVRELREVLMGQRRPHEPSRPSAAQGIQAAVPVSVEFDNTTSDTLTIIDISARDQVGLLYRITKTLYELNLDIASAKIVTEGIRVSDAFYVSDFFRMKIVDQDRLAKIKDALLRMLS